MNEEKAYEKLQELLSLAEELISSGFYDIEEIKSEIDSRTN